MTSSEILKTPYYLIGIDGGGTGTRVLLADAHSTVLAQAQGGPSALGLGVNAAWREIILLCAAVFNQIGKSFDSTQCALGCGLAGADNPGWRAEFIAQAPLCQMLAVETDGYTTLLGAHNGQPGVIVALGTGSVGVALNAEGKRKIIGGYGFPSGDEASGAALGLRIAQHAQRALDARAVRDAFANAILKALGVDDRESMLTWLGNARQTQFAALAPLAFAHADHPFAQTLLTSAGAEIANMIDALDPSHTLPIALCGGLAAAFTPYVPITHSARLRPAQGNSVHGALKLALCNNRTDFHFCK
ncbi:MAG: glucosamine kinase [Glomeribacter sp. 1016415]|nr:glucosamine kinase [Glomeribacter sp. 1016415]